MSHGRSYGLCKKIVAVGKMGKEQMLEKFDVLVLSGGLTDDDYKELAEEVEVDDKELWERLTVVEQSTKSAHHRIDTLDKLTESVHIIATETKAMREDVNDITERVDEIEKKPNKRYETVVTAVITALVGGLIGYFVKMLGF